MEKIRIAFATDDGESFIDRHFGDARRYEIWDVNEEGIQFVKTLPNTVEDEDPAVHADPAKAGGITALLKKEGVHVAAARVFGPNIARIKKRFVCVITGEGDIAAACVQLRNRLQEIRGELQKGEERSHLDFRA